MKKFLLSISHKVIMHPIKNKLEFQEKKLYKCALAVEKDKKLIQEMKDWYVTTPEGLGDEP